MASNGSLHSGHLVVTSAHRVMQLKQKVWCDVAWQPRSVDGSMHASKQIEHSIASMSSSESSRAVRGDRPDLSSFSNARTSSASEGTTATDRGFGAERKNRDAVRAIAACD
jgi:hypothetical protein